MCSQTARIFLPLGNEVVDELFPTLANADESATMPTLTMKSLPRTDPIRWLIVAACVLTVVGNLRAAERPPPRRPNVVLVHGFWDTGAIFDPLVAILEKQGCRCFAPSFQPNDFRDGVRAETLRLRAAVEGRFGRRTPVVFVCMSMGGLAARDYVENFGGATRTRAMFFIATAHRGTVWAATSPQPGVRELAAGSAFLRALNAHVGAMAGIPVRAYWTPFDLIVLPASNTRWPFGDASSQRVLCLTHPAMVRNREVLADIAARIARLPAGR